MRLLFICLTLLSIKSFAQLNPLNDLLKPQATKYMPSWAEFMYQDPISLLKVDSAYKAYYTNHPFEKNHYTRYYKRLIKNNLQYLQESYELSYWSDSQWESYRSQVEKKSESNNLRNPATDWKDIGPHSTQWIANDNARDTFCPWQANIYAFEISPSNPNVLYCVTETGSLYRSSDKGKSWSLRGQNFQLGSESITIHPTDENTILVGVNAAIRRSTDGGNTFTTIFTNNNMGVTDLKYNPSNPLQILAATSTGLWKSLDGGANWTRQINEQCLDIEFHPTLRNIIYILKKNTATNFYECWKSSDNAASFTAKTKGWPSGLTNGVGRLAVSPDKSDWVYAILLTSDKPRLVKTEDRGENWKVTASGETTEFGMDNWQGFYDLDLMVNPKNADELLTGTGSTYRSADGGITFKVIGGYGGNFALHPDLQVCRSNGSDSYICTDGGITYSTDFYNTHSTYRSFGITSTDMWGFGSGWNEDIIVGGRYHNGNTVWHENYGPQTYLRMGGAESPTGYVHPINNKQVYFSDIGSYIMGNTKNDKVISQPMTLWPNESYFSMEFSEIEFHPLYHNVMFLGKDASIYKSENNGISFTKLFTVPESNAVVQHIEISRENPNIIYFSHRNNSPAEGKIWKSTDGGTTWNETTPIPTNAGQRRVMQFVLSEKGVIYAALRTGPNGSKVFKSEDDGKSWINWSSSELDGIGLYSISYQIGSPNETVYVSGNGGKIFYRNKNMSGWQIYNTNLPVNHECRLLRPFYRDNKLRSAAGNGIWEAELFEKSIPHAQASVDKKSTSCNRDTFLFDDYSVLEYDAKQKWDWKFPGASFINSTNIRNPKVVYNSPGEYDVVLKVSNGNGSSERTFQKMIKVLPSECEIELRSGKALSMNGSNKVVTIPVISKLKDAIGLTVMCWIKINDKQQWFTQLISNWGSTSGFGFGFAFQGYVPTTNLTFSWSGVPYQQTTSHEVPINQWTHVAFTIDTNRVVIYMDGKPWVFNKKLEIDLDKTPFVIGNGVPGQGGTFNGQMEELKIYNRTLSQNEIREQMHLINNKPDLYRVLYYQFNENTESTIYDRIGTYHGQNGASSLIKSKVAIGPGTSDRVNVIILQNYTLKNTKTSLDFSGANNLTSPNGEIVLSRINYSPDTINFLYNVLDKDYFVFRNWGTNSSFNGLNNILVDSSNISSANAQMYFRNNANSEGPTWNLNSLKGSLISGKTDGSTSFKNNNLISSASHWIIAGDRLITKSIDYDENEFSIYPNPAFNELFISKILAIHYYKYSIINIDGIEVLNGRLLPNRCIKIDLLRPGIYSIHLFDLNQKSFRIPFIKK